MTAKQRRDYAAYHIRQMKRMEAPFILPILKAIQSHTDKVISILKAKGIEEAKRANEKMLANPELYKPLTDLYKVFGLYMARRTTKEINRSVRAAEQKAGFGIDEGLLQKILTFLNQFIFARVIIPITQTTRDIILEKIIQGEKEGWGITKMVEEIGNTDISRARAYTIVRTESLKAMQYGQQVAADNSRWESVKEWIAADDFRTRQSHRKVDGMQVDRLERFPVPIIRRGIQQGVDLMLGPGDPHATAGNVINCRCTMVTKAKRDSRGRLVHKPNKNISVILE